MPKSFTIKKTHDGAFLWRCKDGSASGWSDSRNQARVAGQAACGHAYEITQGIVEDYDADTYSACKGYDLDDNEFIFPESEISLEYLDYYRGYTNEIGSLNEVQIVITCLKIWGVYNGGTTEAEILVNHNMDITVYDRIKTNCLNLYLTIEDDDSLTWSTLC